MFLPFADWRPDVSDLNGRTSQRMQNVVPTDSGYAPWLDLQPFTNSLPAPCRGYFVARHSSGVFIFAGTIDELYLLDNSTLSWNKVSKGGGPYTPLASDAMWQFAQFNDLVLATQRNEDLQSFDMGTPSAFADVAGSPPNAGSIAVIGSFLVLGDLASDPFGIAWSAINDITGWTPGTNLSDAQTFPAGGRVLRVEGVAQGVGMILQEGGIRRMAFLPGDTDFVFQIDELRDDCGLLSQYAVATHAGRVYFLSTKGFVAAGIDGSMEPIGEERVDRTFLGNSADPAHADLAYDSAQPQLVQAAADPRNNRVVWAYKSIAGLAEQFDRVLVYHITRQRWALAAVSGEFLAQVVRPALTLESLDAIAPGALPIVDVDDNGSGEIRVTVASTATLTTGDVRTISGVGGTTEANGTWTLTVIDGTDFDLDGSAFSNEYTSGGVVAGFLDQLPFSLDDVSTATLPGLSAFSGDHRLGFFTGSPVEARLETPEQRAESRRATINNVWPQTDADTAYVSIAKRERLSETPTDTPEYGMLEDGHVPVFEEARNGRIVMRIPAGTIWTYARGVEVEAGDGGRW